MQLERIHTSMQATVTILEQPPLLLCVASMTPPLKCWAGGKEVHILCISRPYHHLLFHYQKSWPLVLESDAFLSVVDECNHSYLFCYDTCPKRKVIRCRLFVA